MLSPNFIYRIALFAATVVVTFILSISISVPALADETDDIMSEVKVIKANVDSAKAEYMSAVQVSEQFSAQINALTSQIETLDGDIADKRQKLADIVVREYKSPTSMSFIVALGEASSFDEVLKQFEYVSKVAEDRAKTVADIDSLTKQTQENLEELEIKKSESEQAKVDAEAAQFVFNEMLSEMRPQLKDVRERYLSGVANTSGFAQLEQAIAYLEDIDGTTEAQISLLRSAYRTGYAGTDRCESWTEAVYRNAGYSIERYAGAAQCAQALTKSNDLDAIPVGALVFGSGSGSSMGRKYGHVGICVAAGTGNNDALIIDNEGSRTKTAVPLSEWSEWQVSTSWVSGKQGAFAWGYPDSVELNPVDL